MWRCVWRVWRCVEGEEVCGGFGGVWRMWRCVWRVWRCVREGFLTCLVDSSMAVMGVGS